MAMATFSFVPTPSALETRIGSLYFFLSSTNNAPKFPIPPRTPFVNVRVARWRMRFLASSAAAMLTPESAYLMGCGELPLRILQSDEGGLATKLRFQRRL